jgi:hypothetical protein
VAASIVLSMAMHFKSGIPWFQLVLVKSDDSQTVPPHEVNRKLQQAKGIYDQYRASQESDGLTASIFESGALKDKLTAMKVAAQETPLLMLAHIRQLNRLMHHKSRIAVDAMHTAENIYTVHLLPTAN